jgi:peptide/nickel transport system permease protein
MNVAMQLKEPPLAIQPTKKQRKEGYWRLVSRQYRKRKLAVVSLIVLILLAMVALFAPFLAGSVPIYVVYQGESYWLPNVIGYKALVSVDWDRWEPGEGEKAIRPPIPYGPKQLNLRNRVGKPDNAHWLGTDDSGRDVLSRVIWGTRISMSVGFVATGIAIFIGVILGSLAGFYGGIIDAIVLRIIEIVLCFPVFFLILAVMAFLPPNIYNVMIVLGLFGWTGAARLVRGEFLKLRDSEFAMAARASGLRDFRIIFRHILPNALSPVLVAATFGVASAILTESALSFLGFGVPPPTASWGELLAQSQNYLHRGAWWLVTFPGAAIFITVTAFNLVGEGLRDAMDPRLRM